MTILFVREAAGFRQANATEILDCARTSMYEHLKPGLPVLDQPESVKRFLSVYVQPLGREVFGCLYLDSRNRLIEREDLFFGTLASCHVHPREVVRGCVLRNATGIIIYHNHPSGDCTPSQMDEVITRRLKSALDFIDARLLDHWILGERVFSFSEAGLL